LGAQGRPLLSAIQKEVPAEGRHRQASMEQGLERQASQSSSSSNNNEFSADASKQERLAQLKAKLRNSQDDTF
jgi:hypothetical protein